MQADRHQQVKRIFLAACDMAEDARPAYLAEACGQDVELRVEVESLLKHHTSATLIIDDRESATAPAPGETTCRFAPGTILADRFRIVDKLGEGGMGEVYRAEDLRLGQTVALKFLPRLYASDPVWSRNLCREVQLARAVTHQNVCRVYDIGQVNGESFLSMEYVTGESLRSLINRIGRLPREKAIQIARQLCVGLGAAHSQRVLHRDLKPANIMIDGHGQVRITDFGIAALETSPSRRAVAVGTPGYIAPEVLAGRRHSRRSDIYALGLVLYEMVTGRPAFSIDTPSRGLPAAPSEMVSDVDPDMDRLILSCLALEPDDRPASVYAVAASLPGSEPLEFAIAAGETPLPEEVRSARTSPVHPALVLGCMVGALAGLAAAVLLADRTFLVPRAGLVMSSSALEERAETIVRAMGHAPRSPRRTAGFVVDRGSTSPEAPGGGIVFEYQCGQPVPAPARLVGQPLRMEFLEPPAGVITVRLDPRGRLRLYRRVPGGAMEGGPAAPPDWPAIFQLAGLDVGVFREVPPVRRPPVYADMALAWRAVSSEGGCPPIRVEAAAEEYGVVYFEVGQPTPGYAAGTAAPESEVPAMRQIVFLVTLVGAAFLARNNLQMGRCDKRGAWRLAVFMLVADLSILLVRGHHVASLRSELGFLLVCLRSAMFTAVVMWTYYAAMEPLVRRLWPRSIVSWSRVLNGHLRDPLVGRDLMLGCLVGMGIVLLEQISTLITTGLLLQPLPILPRGGGELGSMVGFRFEMDTLLGSLLIAVWVGMALLVLLLLLRVVLRRMSVAMIAFVALTSTGLTWAGDAPVLLPWATKLLLCTALAVILVRIGLLAGIVGLFVAEMLLNTPLTSDAGAWYASSCGFTLTVVIALIAFAVYSSGVIRSLLRRPSTAL